MGADPEMFFPGAGRASGREAAEFCAACPVREACAEFAVAEGLDFGVWGGMVPERRRDLRQRMTGHRYASARLDLHE